MIAWWPGQIKAGTITDQPGHLVDFMPTMLDLAGAKVTDELAGHSLTETLSGSTIERPWPIYWQFGKAQAVRDHNWKLVKLGKGDWELYDLSQDPTELNDLAHDHPEKVKELDAKWQAWWQDKGI